MAQSVKIAGALFSNVPSISVPDENDVYHGFYDTSDANATAGDIAAGKTAYVNGTKITGTASGGNAIVVTDTTDTHGGTIRTITAVDISADTVTAGSMLSGVTAHAGDGTAITGTIATKTSSNLTASGATVTAPAGYYASAASKSVASGTAGTPTATKGTVSNHSISVTPSVTNTTGYIAGSTKTGTAVTVTASELASGNKPITSNGTGIDVVGYSTVSVDVNTGVNVPVFTVTWNSSWTTIQNVTCSMTFSECYDYIDGGLNAGVIVYETDGTETFETSATYYLGSDEYMIFTVAHSGYSSYDITYDSGGGITTRNPSATKVTPGTPTASKGAASNHSITVTPSVTNPAGYIDGGTITGTGVTVSASELASGNKAITANGTGIDVVGYSTVSVAVPKTYTATLSGTGNASNCYVQCPSGGTKYYTAGDTFEFTAGTGMYVYTQYSGGVSQIIEVNGETVKSSTTSTNYTYYPEKDINIRLNYSPQGGISISESVIPSSYRPARTITPSTAQQTAISSGGYATGNIVVSPISGSLNITGNGTYNVVSYAEAVVNVPGGVSSLQYDTKTVTASNYPVSLEFTSMKGEPKAFVCRLNAQVSSSGSTTYYYIVDIANFGTTTHGNCFRIGSTRRVDNITSGYSWSYSGTTLTITSSAASRSASPGAFYSGSYELLYCY